MIEAFRHFFGMCGEPHPSILCALGISPLLVLISVKIKKFFSFLVLGIKTLLKHLM